MQEITGFARIAEPVKFAAQGGLVRAFLLKNSPK
jgi:hypothetical protein